MTEEEYKIEAEQAFGIHGIPVVDDLEIEALKEEQDRARKEKQILNAIEDSTKNLAAPGHWTLENWRPYGEARVGGKPATMEEAIVAMIAGASGIISGETNSGKSHLAVAIARERVRVEGLSCFRVKDFNLAVAAEVNRYRQSMEYIDIITKAKCNGIHIHDDAGKNACYTGGSTTYYGNVLFGIMDERAENRRQTIMTTRIMNGEVLRERMGDDLIRRFQQAEAQKLNHVSIMLKV